MEDESIAGEDMEQEETAAAKDSSSAVETSDSEPRFLATRWATKSPNRPRRAAQLTSPRWTHGGSVVMKAGDVINGYRILEDLSWALV